MHRADKAVLRFGLGMGLSVAIAWGVALEAAFMAPVMTLTLLAKPGPPIPISNVLKWSPPPAVR